MAGGDIFLEDGGLPETNLTTLPEAGPAAVVSRSANGRDRRMGQIVFFLGIIALALVLAFCFFASSICITILLASFLAIVVDPLITYLQRWHISRMLSSAFVIIAVMLGLGAGTYVSYKHVLNFVDDAPEYARRVGEAIAPFTKRVQKVQDSAGKLNADLPTKKVTEVKLRSEFPDWTSYVIRGVGPVSGIGIIVAVVPFLMFFLLIQKERLLQKLSIIWGDRVDIGTFARNVTVMVRAFVLGNLIIGLLMALSTAALLRAFHVQGAILLGVVSGFLNLVPFVGAVLAAILPMAAAIFQYQPVSTIALICVAVIALHTISANLLVPRMIGKRVSISPVAATVGILFWGWLWGVIGVLLAVPLTALVKIVADAHPSPSLGKLADLLAERPGPAAGAASAASGVTYADLAYPQELHKP
jgi:predicted PurR-regulated permease PerM